MRIEIEISPLWAPLRPSLFRIIQMKKFSCHTRKSMEDPRPFFSLNPCNMEIRGSSYLQYLGYKMRACASGPSKRGALAKEKKRIKGQVIFKLLILGGAKFMQTYFLVGSPHRDNQLH
jgi:hypothetical protein